MDYKMDEAMSIFSKLNEHEMFKKIEKNLDELWFKECPMTKKRSLLNLKNGLIFGNQKFLNLQIQIIPLQKINCY